MTPLLAAVAHAPAAQTTIEAAAEHAWWQTVWELLLEHMGVIAGVVLAVLVASRLMMEKRNPSNVFAWGLLILFVPWLGAPLYFLFGGRKSRRLVETKLRINAYAAQLAAGMHVTSPPMLVRGQPLTPRRKFAYNTFHLLGDGVATFVALREQIARAQRTIYVQTFILGRDEDARQIVDDLAARARAGVEVKLLIDAIGSLGSYTFFVEPLRKAGGKVARFMPVVPIETKTSANLRNHRKIAMFDGDRAIVGGQNIDQRFIAAHDSPGLFLDFSALIEGPVVAAFNRNFVCDWCFAAGDSPRNFREMLAHIPESRGPNEIEVMTSGPDVAGDPLWERLLVLIQQCEHEVTIVTPYFIPDEVLFRSLMIQAHIGKRVRIIVPDKSNHPLTDFARHHFLRQLHEAGAEILFYKPKMNHGKLMIVDGKIAVMGSANMDMRSLFVNFEIGVFLYSPEPVSDLRRWAESLCPDCVSYAESGYAKAGANRRFMEDFAHLLGPLL